MVNLLSLSHHSQYLLLNLFRKRITFACLFTVKLSETAVPQQTKTFSCLTLCSVQFRRKAGYGLMLIFDMWF